MDERTSKEKGDLLEEIVKNLCSGFEHSKVTRDVKMEGKSGIERQIDVLIEARHKSFDIKIIVEAKNYSKKVGVEKVESLKTKLIDVGGNLGVIVCPLGFTKGALNVATLHDIQLFQVFDHKLGNTTEFIPLRYIVPSMKNFSLQIEHGSSGGGTFELPTDTKKWRFHIGDKIFDQYELLAYAWNQEMFPQDEGEQVVDFGVVKISTVEDSKIFFYLEFKANVFIYCDFYLKLFPASFMRNVKSGRGNHQLFIDAYSKKEDMLKNGWQCFDTKEEMETAAAVHDTSKDIKGLTTIASYTIEVN
ncbi:MAG: restriction endonuclease [Patescibacteria group bacterium]